MKGTPKKLLLADGGMNGRDAEGQESAKRLS
jgi:hypothetical protein